MGRAPDLESWDMFGTVGAIYLRFITLVRALASRRVEDSAPPAIGEPASSRHQFRWPASLWRLDERGLPRPTPRPASRHKTWSRPYAGDGFREAQCSFSYISPSAGFGHGGSCCRGRDCCWICIRGQTARCLGDFPGNPRSGGASHRALAQPDRHRRRGQRCP